MKQIVLSFAVPEFVQGQRESFLTLLKEGIPNELNKRNPIVIPLNKSDLKKNKEEKRKKYRILRKYSPKKMKACQIIFHGNSYKLMRPQKSIKQVILNGNTYSSRLYVPIEIKFIQIPKFSKMSQRKWVFLGNLPLMTPRGHFIINGSPRVVLHQMIRSPGIYFHDAVNIYKDKRRVYADLICHRGVWLRMEIDRHGYFWMRTKKYPKIPMLKFLQSLGLEHPHFMAQFSLPIIESPLLFLGKIRHFKENYDIVFKAKSFLDHFFRGRNLKRYKTQLSNQDPAIKEAIQKIKSAEQRTEIEISQTVWKLIKSEKIRKKSTRNLFLEGTKAQKDLKTLLLNSPLFLETFTKIKNRYQCHRPMQYFRWGKEPTKSMERVIKILYAAEKLKALRLAVLRSKPNANSKPISLLTFLFLIKKPMTFEKQMSFMFQLQEYFRYFWSCGKCKRCRNGKPAECRKAKKESTKWKARKRKGTILDKAKRIFKSKMRAQLSLSKFILFEQLPSSISDKEFIKSYRNWKSGAFGSAQWAKKHQTHPSLISYYKRYRNDIPNSYNDFINEWEFLRYDNWKKGKTELNSVYIGNDETETFEFFDEFFDHFKNDILRRTRQFFVKTFLKSKAYDLGKIGRIQLNRKLGLNKPLTQLTLTLDDLICIMTYLRAVKTSELPPDDIDHLKNRRIRTSGELIQNQIGIGLIRFERFTKKKSLMAESEKKLFSDIQSCFRAKHVDRALKEFFHSSPLSQFMDETNPLAEITHKRRLSALGPGGITQDTASLKMRSIHPSHYGRICPIETPEGPNAGLVNSLTTYARINPEGFLETPFYKVFEGQIYKNDNRIVYLSAAQSETENIASSDLAINSINRFLAEDIPILVNNDFLNVCQKEVDFVCISRIQLISIATSLIPFVEHDDANRALMGSNMQRQSVPLLSPERPIVGTGLEGRILSDSSQTIQTKSSGIVTYASAQKIQIFSFIKLKNGFFRGILTNYFLKNYQKSNQNTCIVHRPLVHEGDWVEKGACLVDSSSTAKGELAIGKNLLVAYLPWEGYNFEDAILISERLIYDHLFTSIHISQYAVDIKETELGQEIITSEKFPWEISFDPEHLDRNGIIQVGTWVSEGDILVRKMTPIDSLKLSNYEKFLYKVLDVDLPTHKDTSLRVPKGVHGRVISIKSRKTKNRLITKPMGSESVIISIAEKKTIQVGDKMSGRHGNKGIVSRILAREDMPYLQDGTPVDMVLNPLGVPSRMNVGQIYEALLGLAGKHLNQNYKVIPFDEVSGPYASRSLVFSKLAEAKRKTGKKWLFNAETPGKMRVFDGRTGQPFDQSITVGQPYILKLIHMVDDKIHARSTGPYSLVTQQPLRGRSKKGGQRFGEMEVWALEGFGAAYTLQEILTIKSDDIQGRKQITDSFLYNQRIFIGRPESFRVLIRELQALCIQIEVIDEHNLPMNIDSDEFNRYQIPKILQEKRQKMKESLKKAERRKKMKKRGKKKSV